MARRNFDESGAMIFCFGKQARPASSLAYSSYSSGELVSLLRLIVVSDHGSTVTELREELLSLRQMAERRLVTGLKSTEWNQDRERALL